MSPRPRHCATLLAAAVVLLAACGSPASSASSSSSPSSAAGSPEASPSLTPASRPPDPTPDSTPSAAPSAGDGESVIVTFRVADTEEYRVQLTEPGDIEIARQLLAGDELAPRIPNGRVVRGGDGGVNTGYSWHIDPNDIEFADVTIEVCDGLPSDVEAGQISDDRFCPWSAEVIDIEE